MVVAPVAVVPVPVVPVPVVPVAVVPVAVVPVVVGAACRLSTCTGVTSPPAGVGMPAPTVVV